MFYILMALVIGFFVPVQTAVNSRLRSFVLSPFIASLISFLVGTIFLFFITLLTKHTILIPLHIFSDNPLWIWTGGLLGFVALTGNILLFPKLGGVQTVVLPIMGQIIMSMLVDHFGWFHAPQQSFSLLRALGVSLLVVGVLCVVVLPDYLRKKRAHVIEDEPHRLPFQILGIIFGMMMAAQSAVNGYLGLQLESPIHAAFVSFTVGTIALIIVNIIQFKKFKNIKFAFGKDKPIWLYAGGIIGAFFVFGMSYLVPIIGTGLVVVSGLFGQLVCSIMIDKFGWIGARKADVTGIQYLGLTIIVVAVIMIKLF